MEKKRGRITALVVVFATIITLVFGGRYIASAETVTYATVTASSAKVRSNTDTSSEVVGSLKSGDQVQILSEVTDANGQVWYKVNVVGGTGYVRGDLVTKGEPQEVDTTNTTTTTETTPSTDANTTTNTETTTAQNTQTTVDLPDTQVTAMDSTSATVTTSKANVRSGAGTAYSVAGSVASGDVVTITGTANDSAGKQWYYITLSNGVQGFIRADLVQLGAATPADQTGDTGEQTDGGENTENPENPDNTDNTDNTEGTDTQETTEPAQEQTNTGNAIVATTSSDSYYVFIDTDGTYQLVKNTDGSPVKYSVEGILAANDYIQTHGTQKAFGLLDIILIVLVIVLAGAVIFLFIRLRNLLYYDDEGGNYEDDNMQYDEEPKPRKAGFFEKLRSKKNDGYDEGYEDGYPEDGYPEDGYPEDGYPEDYPEEEPAPDNGRGSAVNGSTVRPERDSRPTPRKSRNFADDDDFEFEFLDLDNDNDGKRR